MKMAKEKINGEDRRLFINISEGKKTIKELTNNSAFSEPTIRKRLKKWNNQNLLKEDRGQNNDCIYHINEENVDISMKINRYVPVIASFIPLVVGDYFLSNGFYRFLGLLFLSLVPVLFIGRLITVDEGIKEVKVNPEEVERKKLQELSLN